jgi:hypothetical protein
MAGKFQIFLDNRWQNYSDQEDKVLKRAFMAGFPHAKFKSRGQEYVYDFTNMNQSNKMTGKDRRIRPPHKWTAPNKPLVPQGKTTVVNVPKGSPGSTIQVPYPGQPGKFIAVTVPAKAKAGQAMLVPVPPLSDALVVESTEVKKAGGSWSTGAKVVGGGALLAGVGGVAVGGAILGDHIAEHGFDATLDAVGDGLEDVGETLGDFAVDAGEFIVDAGEDLGDFIMDLF